jgi:hypothetical protein
LTELGVVGYGISLSTLEEVFMKVGHLDDEGNRDGLDNNTRRQRLGSVKVADKKVAPKPDSASGIIAELPKPQDDIEAMTSP